MRSRDYHVRSCNICISLTEIPGRPCLPKGPSLPFGPSKPFMCEYGRPMGRSDRGERKKGGGVFKIVNGEIM